MRAAFQPTRDTYLRPILERTHAFSLNDSIQGHTSQRGHDHPTTRCRAFRFVVARHPTTPRFSPSPIPSELQSRPTNLSPNYALSRQSFRGCVDDRRFSLNSLNPQFKHSNEPDLHRAFNTRWRWTFDHRKTSESARTLPDYPYWMYPKLVGHRGHA
jgi:hypothetical protein